MAEIGSASLLIVPKFDNLSASIDKALGAAEKPASTRGKGIGESTGKGFSTGLASSGAAIGAFSALASRAFDSITSHIGSAISRFDTLNQYPKTMEMLGYSTEEASASIEKMSDRLSTLPTRLDDMTSMVQGIVAITGDLEQATDAGLALNDMLVASGSNQQLVTAAMEQFRQMLAKGKPEMEDWKSLTAAMPGQMQQLAEAMLGPTANANDLYAALGGGKNDPTITMDQLLDKMIELDTVGGPSITSFKEQAETAAGGIQTAMANTSNAITKGLAGMLESIGKENIAGVFNDIKSGINDAFGTINSVVSTAMPAVKSLYGAFKELLPALTGAAGGFLAFKGVSAVFSKLSGAVSTGKALGEALAMTAGGAGTLTESLSVMGFSINPVSAAIGALAVVAGVAAVAFSDWQQKQENLTAATQGLSDAVADTTSLDDYSGRIRDVGEEASFSAMSVDELAESTAKHVEVMQQNNEKAQETIATLSTAQGIINQYAGQTDLSAQAQGRLEWALQTLNEQLGLNISQQDVMNGQYTDADGNVRNLTQSVNELVEAKKREAQAAALTANLTEAYQVQADAADTLAQAQKDYNDRVQWHLDANPGITRARAEELAATSNEARALEDATDQYESATKGVKDLETEVGDLAAATSESADAFDEWGLSTGALFSSQLESYGTNLSMLKDDLRSLGADTTQLGTLTEEQLGQLAATYDGTAGSIIDLLDEWGVSMDETAKSAAEMADEIKGVFDGFGGDFTESLEGAGVDLDTFAQKLAAAEVSTQQLKDYGAANIQELATIFQGNVDMMVWAIDNYNNVPILDKNGVANIEDVSLIDAQNNIWTWNGSTLVNQYGQAIVDDTQLIDAQGNVWVWNGSTLIPLNTTATVDGNATDGSAATGIDDTNTATSNMTDKGVDATVNGNALTVAPQIQNTADAIRALKSKTVNVSVNYSTSGSAPHAAGGIRLNAEGGIRPHADGGIVPRYHAGGAIATKAVPLDIVGEAGAEAIVPLTNRRYSEPFAEIIAEQVEDKRADAPTTVNQTVNFNQPIQSPYQVRAMLKRYATYGLAGARR